jgi:hypothetical protein
MKERPAVSYWPASVVSAFDFEQKVIFYASVALIPG